MSDDLNRQLGEHIRKLRKQLGRSLHDVERSSNGDFKASVLGAYERGERAISVARLDALAKLYGVPLAAMLPTPGDGQDAAAERFMTAVRGELTRLLDEVGRPRERKVR